LYAVYSYAEMTPGVQWTALWYRNGELVHYETKLWEGSTGGYDYADCTLPVEKWLAGNYEVQIFVGEDWKVVGRFILEGNPPTATLTVTPSPTISPTSIPSLTPTYPPTSSRTATRLPVPTGTH